MGNESSLVPCPSCARHAKSIEQVCPFCGAVLPRHTRRPGVGISLGAAILVAASGCSPAAVGAYGPPPEEPSAPAESEPDGVEPAEPDSPSEPAASPDGEEDEPDDADENESDDAATSPDEGAGIVGVGAAGMYAPPPGR